MTWRPRSTETIEEALIRCSERQGDCLIWKLSTDRKGYGQLTLRQVHLHAHREAYKAWVGPLEPRVSVRHTCDNPACIEPTHLLKGTHKQNMEDMAKRQRNPAGEDAYLAKYPNDLVIAVKARYAEGGVTYAALAKEFNVHPATVGDWIRGKSRRREVV